MLHSKIHSFASPIYVTRPIFPEVSLMSQKLACIWDSRQITNGGRQHQDFERELLYYLDVPYLSLINNGTTALMLGVKALDLSGEVITTPFTFPATPHSLTWNNITPVFCDVDDNTFNLNPEKIKSLINSRTTGILPVHTFGVPCDVQKIHEIAQRYQLKVFYDAADAFGVQVDGIGIGNFGDMSMMSLHATKIFHAAEGGVLISKSDEIKKYIELVKNFGIRNEEEVVEAGINGKMNELQAALGLLVLDYLRQEQKKRGVLIDAYRQLLYGVDGIVLRADMPSITYNNSCFVIRIEEKFFGKSRDYVYSRLKEYNVFARKYFSPLCSQFPFYKKLASSHPENLPVATKIAKQVLRLPLYGELAVSDVEKICGLILLIKNGR